MVVDDHFGDVADEPASVPFLKISYPATAPPVSGVDAVHDSVNDVPVTADWAKPVGTLGGAGVVVTDSGVLAGEIFPAASFAFTVML